MKKKQHGESGLLSLEASIAVTIFIFLMLFMYSFFVIFEARNKMAHTLLSTSNSLALDAYANETLGNSDAISKLLNSLYGNIINDDNQFTDTRLWYESAGSDETSVPTGLFAEVVEERFVAYLTNGEPERAGDILSSYHIVGGLDGLDFTGSYVSGNDLHIKVSYTIEYEFNMFGLGTLEMEQSACSKLWKQGE